MRYWAVLAVALVIAGVLVALEFFRFPFGWAMYATVAALTIALFTFLFRRRRISRDPVDGKELHAGDSEGLRSSTASAHPH